MINTPSKPRNPLSTVFSRLLFASMLMLSLLTPGMAQAAKLVVLYVGDTSDNTAGGSIETDLNAMRKTTAEIAKYTGLEPHEHTIVDYQVTPDHVLEAIDDLKVDEDDVLLFWHCSHGFRHEDKDPNPWPDLFFHLTMTGLDYQEVIDMLKAKSPRLLLSMVVVCNSYTNSENPPWIIDGKKTQRAVDTASLRKHYRALFLKQQGSVISTSSHPGETSGFSNHGSHFVVSFLHRLNEEVRQSDNPNWQHLADGVVEDVMKFGSEDQSEEPYFEVDVENID